MEVSKNKEQVQIFMNCVFRPWLLFFLFYYVGKKISYHVKIRWLGFNLPFSIPQIPAQNLDQTFDNVGDKGSLNLFCQGRLVSFKADWIIKTEDEETLCYFHRWNWLLQEGLNKKNIVHIDSMLVYIDSWAENFFENRNSIIWEPYTTGERICNLCLFLGYQQNRLTNLPSIPSKYQALLLEHARYLSQHLEYYGEQTCNHIINNARALAFAGVTLNQGCLVKLAVDILQKYLPILVSSSGFLREESSHYQFLFTRWLLECYWLGSVGGQSDLLEVILPYLPNLIKRSNFFLVETSEKYSLPFFGDISPDCTWQWLCSLPFSTLAKSIVGTPGSLVTSEEKSTWANLFSHVSLNTANFIAQDVSSERHTGCQLFETDGWCRIDQGVATLFVYLGHHGAPNFPTHGHEDFLSFCLFVNGQAVIVDGGRSTYVQNEEGKYGLSSQAHNVVTLNGYGANNYALRGWAPQTYFFPQRPKVKLETDPNGEGIVLSVEHGAFRRLRPEKVSHTRVFKLLEQSLIVEDHFVSCKGGELQSFFHFHPSFQLKVQQLNKLSCLVSSDKCCFEYSAKISGIEKVSLQEKMEGFAENYGEQQKASVLNFKGNIPKGNAKLTQSLSWS